MKIKKAYKYRFKPNKEQQQALAIQFGHARFTYNYALGRRKEHYQLSGKGLSYNALGVQLAKNSTWRPLI